MDKILNIGGKRIRAHWVRSAEVTDSRTNCTSYSMGLIDDILYRENGYSIDSDEGPTIDIKALPKLPKELKDMHSGELRFCSTLQCIFKLLEMYEEEGDSMNGGLMFRNFLYTHRADLDKVVQFAKTKQLIKQYRSDVYVSITYSNGDTFSHIIGEKITKMFLDDGIICTDNCIKELQEAGEKFIENDLGMKNRGDGQCLIG